MVRGKPSSQLDQGVDIPITLPLEIGFYMLLLINTTGAGRKKGKRLFGNDPMLFRTCVLGLPCKVGNSIRIVRLSRILRLLDPFATQSSKSNIMRINLDV